MSSSVKYYGGVLGGGTHTEAIIVSADGTVVGRATGGPTNPNQVTFDVCVSEIHKLLIEAMTKAGITPNRSYPLQTVGLSLSGGEHEEGQKRIIAGLSSTSPFISFHYYVQTDTFGPIAAAFPSWGMILIAGTGSNCEVVLPDGRTHRCGGWGHMLGDEGSGYWIAHRGIKLVYSVTDGYQTLPEGTDISVLKNTVYSYFDLKVNYDIIPHLYEKFDKTRIAQLCKKLSEVVKETNDPLCRQLFIDGGRELGKQVMALIPRIDPSIVAESEGRVPVLAEGSVFKSWDLLESGFKEVVNSSPYPISLYTLTDDSLGPVGAAILGARKAPGDDHVINIDYKSTTKLIWSST